MKESVKNWFEEQMPGLDGGELEAIYGEYRESAARMWSELRAKKDAGAGLDELCRIAHALKGSAATVGDTETFECVQGWRLAVMEGRDGTALWERIGPSIDAI